MTKERKELIKEADEILGLTRGPGHPSNAAQAMRLLSERAVAMVLGGDGRSLKLILQSLQSEAEAKEEEKGGSQKKDKTKTADFDVIEEKQVERKGEGERKVGEGKHEAKKPVKKVSITKPADCDVIEDEQVKHRERKGDEGKHMKAAEDEKKPVKGEASSTEKTKRVGGLGAGATLTGEDDACIDGEISPCRTKQTILVKVKGDASMDPGSVLTTLGHLVRDYNISKRRDEVIKCLGIHSYYLRPRRTTSDDHPDEVDHTFECQMLAHAIFQTSDYHPILKQLDINTSSTSFKKQPSVVEGALKKLKNIQNCVDDPTLFNLKMLNKSLNITKGSVIKQWLNDRLTPTGSHLKKADLRVAYLNSSSVQDGIIDRDEAYELAAILANNLVCVEGIYIERLGKAAELVDGSSATITDKSPQKKRLVGLQDTISGLQEEHKDY